MKEIKSIGLMSGTSVDGSVSAALIQTDGEHSIKRLANLDYAYETMGQSTLRPIHHFTKAGELAYRQAKGDHKKAFELYPQVLDQYLSETYANEDASQRANRLAELKAEFLVRIPERHQVDLETVIFSSTKFHAEAVEKLIQHNNLRTEEVSFIGYHGQTLYHAPFDGISIQVGDPQYLANRLGIPVAFEFRSQDIKHGGQGAPLAPIYHRALARQAGYDNLCILNLGGTANISIIPEANEHLIAFDTGPANGLIDKWMKEKANQAFDENSQYAFKGQVNAKALQVLLDKAILLRDGRSYLEVCPPKSLDIRDYHYHFPEMECLSLEDGCATLNAFTAACIARGLDWIKRDQLTIPQQWIVCGGGVFNLHLRQQIINAVKETQGIDIELKSADDVGWSSSAMEAELFAFLAVRVDRKLPLSFPRTTGVKLPLTGGMMFYPK